MEDKSMNSNNEKIKINLYPTKSSFAIYDHSFKHFRIQELPVYTEHELKAASAFANDFFMQNNFLVMAQGVFVNSNLPSTTEPNRGRPTLESCLEYLAGIPQSSRVARLGGRGLVGVKLGKLYIEYDMEGKASFSLSVSLLDFKNKRVKPLIKNFSQARFGSLRLSDIIPFSSLYNATLCGGRPSPEILEKAAAIKKVLTRLALGLNVSEEEIQAAFTDLFVQNYAETVKDTPLVIPSEVKPVHSPQAIQEVAVKLYQIYIEELEISSEHLFLVFKAYKDQSKKVIDKTFVTAVLEAIVEKQRGIPLKALADVKTADEFIVSLKSEESKFLLGQGDVVPSAKAKENLIDLLSLHVPEDYNSKDRVINYFLNSTTSTAEVITAKEAAWDLIEKVKSNLRIAVQKSLSRNYNLIADSQLGKFIGGGLGLPIENLKYMKELLPLLDELRCYSDLKEFADAIDYYIDKIKPFGTSEFLKEAQLNQNLIHEAMGETHFISAKAFI